MFPPKTLPTPAPPSRTPPAPPMTIPELLSETEGLCATESLIEQSRYRGGCGGIL
jgi:hypothetical protein